MPHSTSHLFDSIEAAKGPSHARVAITLNLHPFHGQSEGFQALHIKIPFGQDVPLDELLDIWLKSSAALRCEEPANQHQSCPSISESLNDRAHGHEVFLSFLDEHQLARPIIGFDS